MKNLWVAVFTVLCFGQVQAQKISFVDVSNDFQSFRSSEAFQKVFTSQKQFFLFCEENKINPPADFSFPSIDFSKNFLVFICDGIHRNGGTELEINKMTKGKSGLLINFTVKNPQPGCPVTDAITYPIKVVTVKRFTGLGKPKFSPKVVAVPCL